MEEGGGQKSWKVVKREAEMEMEGDDEEGSKENDDLKKKDTAISRGSGDDGLGRKGSTGGGATAMRYCQAEKCKADLSGAKQYYRRHKVCEHHSKAEIVLVAGIRQRFCQQCSRFHDLSEFDQTKRSCRRRLAGHNERRRKNSTDSHGEGEASSKKGTGTELKDMICSQADARGRIKLTIQDNSTYKHFRSDES